MKNNKEQELDYKQWRLREILRLHKQGYTCSEIGKRVGLSRQRIHQILRAQGGKDYKGIGQPRTRTCEYCGEPFQWDGRTKPACPRCTARVCTLCGGPCTRGAKTCRKCYMKRHRKATAIRVRYEHD